MGLSTPLQCLLQTFFSQNALTENNLRAVIAELVYAGERDRVDRQVINETIATINDDLSDLDFEIRRTIEQMEGKDIWVLCNATSDHLTQMATAHTQNDIQYFKALLTYMFVKNNTRMAEVFAVAKMDAVNQATSVGLTKAQGEQVLNQFVEESWLQRSPHGYYTLTARTLMELQGYLKDTFNDNDDEVEAIKSCHACREFLTMGYRCPNLNCTCRLHYKCYEGFFRRSMRCPVCQEVDWNKSHLTYVGERAAKYQQNGGGATNGDLDSDADGDEVDDDDIEVSQ